MESKVENQCDRCGHKLETRNDDNETTFETRYQTYLENTLPLLDYYKRLGMLYHVDSTKSTEEVFQSIIEILERGVSHD